MLDWVTCLLPLRHTKNIGNGEELHIDRDGVLRFYKVKPEIVEGSSKDTIAIKTGSGFSDGYFETIAFSGNPVKFLQGHNLFGIDQLTPLVYATVLRIAEALSIEFFPEDLERVKAGDYQVSRVDVTYMYDLDSRSDVRAWIRAAEDTTSLKYRGRGNSNRGTLYFGKHSRYWALKIYCKGDEVDKRRSISNPIHLRRLYAYADNKLRIELVLRSKQLKRLGLNRANEWSEEAVQQIYDKHLENLDLSNNMTVPATTLAEMPGALRAAYALWEKGEDLKAILPRRTYYRYKKGLSAFGVNIDAIQPKTTNVVQLKRVLVARPATVPDWAYGTDAFFAA